MATTGCTVLGTIITVTIDANQEAVFECQLDDSSFVPCNNRPILSRITFSLILCTGTSGFQYSGVPSGPHTITVKANSTESGEEILRNCTIEVEVLAVDILGITGV